MAKTHYHNMNPKRYAIEIMWSCMILQPLNKYLEENPSVHFTLLIQVSKLVSLSKF